MNVHSKYLRRLLCFVTIFLVISIPLSVQAKAVRLGVDQNRPLIFTADGQAMGLYMDILRPLAQAQGWDIQPQTGPWGGLLESTRAGKLDLLAAVAYSEERAKTLDFTRETILVNWARVYAAHGKRVESFFDLAGSTVAMVRGDIHSQAFCDLMAQFCVSFTPLEVGGYAGVFAAVDAGRADAGVVNRQVARRLEQDYDLDPTPIIFNPIELRLAVPKGDPAGLLPALDAHVAALKASKDSIYYRALDTWLGGAVPEQMPGWVGWAVLGALLLVLGLVLATLVLRRKVMLKTRELSAANALLQAEVEERTRAAAALRESERNFRDLFDNAPLGIFRTSPGGRYLSANAKLAQIYGYDSPEQLVDEVKDIGRQVFVDPENRQRLLRLMEFQDVVEDFEVLSRRRDGQVIWTSRTLRVVRDDQGRAKHYDGFITDVTERRRGAEKMRHEQAINRALADVARAMAEPGASIASVAEVVHRWALDVTGSRYGFVSAIDPQTGDNVGLTLSAMMDREDCKVPGRGVCFPRGPQGYPGLWGVCLNTCAGFICNSPESHPAARGLPVGHAPVHRFLAAPACVGQRPVGMVALANPDRQYDEEDLRAVEALAGLFALAVQRIRMEEDIRAARTAAEAANRAKGEFLANMSHEIRTPLNGMFGMLQLALMGELDEEQRNYLTTALASGRSLLRILGDILDFSKLEMGKVDLALEPFDLQETLDQVDDIFDLETRAKGLEFSARVLGPTPVRLVGDQARIRQVLINLVGNAVKFTEQGGVRVTASTLRHPGKPHRVTLFLEVADTGIGIPESSQDLVFEAFAQADASSTRRYQGTGLGLSIVRRLIQLMGGSLAVESEPGRGATFTVAVPLAALPRGEEPAPAPAAEASPGRPLRILLAEDDRVNQLAARRALELGGHTVSSAANGQEVLRLLAGGDFDCILMDVQMPLMDGLEATRAIRGSASLGARSAIPIIALTAHAMKGDRERFLAAGMDAYIAKPVDMDELAAVLASLAAGRDASAGS